MLTASVLAVGSAFSGLFHVVWEIKESHVLIDKHSVLIEELKNTCASSKVFQRGAYKTERYNTQLIKKHLNGHK